MGSGTGVLEFAVEGEREYYTWEGSEDEKWEVNDVGQVENIEEDRFIMYPAGEYFICEIELISDSKDVDESRARCWSD